MSITKNSKIWFTISAVLVGMSILSIVIWGFKPGIDFTGGSLMRIEFPNGRISNEQIREALISKKGQAEAEEDSSKDLGHITIQAVGEKETIIKLNAINESTHQEILKNLEKRTIEIQNSENAENISSQKYIIENKFDSIGPSIGEELKEKSKIAIMIVLLAIVSYIAWAFRSVSSKFNKYESFRYGISAIVALVHDILIVLGIFAVLGRFLEVELDTFFIAALLTILGYSVNDTIIVFDRIRENVLREGEEKFNKIVDKSIKEIWVRSLNTSMTTLIVLFCVLFFGGRTTFYFVLALIIGIISGTYSSIFLASPLLVWWKKKRSRF